MHHNATQELTGDKKTSAFDWSKQGKMMDVTLLPEYIGIGIY